MSTRRSTTITQSNLPLLLHNLVQQRDDCGAELLSLVEHYIQQCCNTYYTLGHAEKEDIAQEASVKLLLHYEDIKHTISRRWLYVMVKNLCIDALRKQRANSQLNLSHSKDASDSDNSSSPELEDFEYSSRFDNRECLDNVFTYIASQPQGKEDITIYSHFAYGLSRADIAHMTGRTVSAITKRISILRSRLKDLRDELC